MQRICSEIIEVSEKCCTAGFRVIRASRLVSPRGDDAPPLPPPPPRCRQLYNLSAPAHRNVTWHYSSAQHTANKNEEMHSKHFLVLHFTCPYFGYLNEIILRQTHLTPISMIPVYRVYCIILFLTW